MAKLDQAFDSNQHEDMNDFEPFPADKYNMQITKSEVKVTSKKTGKFIKFEISVLDGKYKGRKVWTQLNVVNPNPIAVEIAEKEMATICRACGKPQVQDTEELHGIPFLGLVGIKQAKGDYPAQNKMNGYKPLSSAAADAASKVKPGASKKPVTKTKPKKAPVVAEDAGPGWD